MKLAVIVPNLPPASCGVYDYTEKLCRHWGGHADWTLLCSQPGTSWPGSKSVSLRRDAGSLAQALGDLSPDAVLLQYTCYGYAENGVPRWLAEGLAKFKLESSARLAVMFHELWYTGRVWTRAFWRNSGQREVARRLCAVSDAVLTGVPLYAQELSKLGTREVIFSPIASNIEPVESCRHEGRLVLGVFGLPATRERALKIARPLLDQLAARHVDFEVRVIGAGAGDGLSAREATALKGIAAGNISRFEHRDAALVSRALAACHIVLPAVMGPELYKSGSAMAALAHGCALATTNRPPADIPVLQLSLSDGAALQDLRNAAKEIGAAGQRWYEKHSGWARAVAAWKAALGSCKRV